MTEREIFWHNFRILRPKMRDALPEDWQFMKAVAKVGLINAMMGKIASDYMEQFIFASGGIVGEK